MKEHAFPSPVDPKTGTNQLGMTLRDYFAAQAMKTLKVSGGTFQDFAKHCYEMADAMMEVRK
jgi:hypothetical protein